MFGLSGTAISITKSVLTMVAATITIIALTYFMLLEGPTWLNRFYSLFSAPTEKRLRSIFGDIGTVVGGYVTGNLFISVIAGVSSGLVLWIMDVPFALALGLLVALLDLVPLVGATIAAIIVTTVAFVSTDSVWSGIVVLIFFVVYQQLENHLLQPLVYGRTVQLSPLIVLIAVLIGASLAGVLGALGAIPDRRSAPGARAGLARASERRPRHGRRRRLRRLLMHDKGYDVIWCPPVCASSPHSPAFSPS